MTTKITYLIVPAFSDQAGQCRIVAMTHTNKFKAVPNLALYRAAPDMWREVGIMNSRGHIVCLAPSHPSHHLHMKRDEPLMAGTTYTFIDGKDADAVA